MQVTGDHPAGCEDGDVVLDGDGARPEQVGWFRFYFDSELWEWSPEVQRMHGYEPGSVSPTTELVLSHKHPDDYQAILLFFHFCYNPINLIKKVVFTNEHIK